MGLARNMNGESYYGNSWAGTVNYMSPEMTHNEKLKKSTDIW